jgi:hypothetical protein
MTQPFVTLTTAGLKEKVRLRVDTILGVRPCGTDAYGANIDVTTAAGVVSVEEDVETVWKAIQEAKGTTS